MARDYEDLYNLSSMEDGEIRDLIHQQLSEYDDLDPDEIDIAVEEGHVTLSGRVGTEHDYQRIEQVLTDVIRVSGLTNDLVVDELRRPEQPEAADDAASARIGSGESLRGGANRTEDSAEHLLQDTAAEQFGTDSASEAIERGYSYEPPTTPPQQGSWSKENH